MLECTPAYAFVKVHTFVKSVTFLRLNGWHFVTEAAKGIAFMEGLTSGEVSEVQFAVWMQPGSTVIK